MRSAPQRWSTPYSSLFIEFEQAQNIVRGSQDSLALASVFSTYPHPALSVGQAFLVEVVITAILMAVIMALPTTATACRAVRWRRC